MTPDAFAHAYQRAVEKLRTGPTPTSLIPSSLDMLSALHEDGLQHTRVEVLAFARRYCVRLADLDD